MKPEYNKFNLNELMQRKKYSNPRNLLKTEFQFDEIDNSEKATIAFLIVQSRINGLMLNYYAMQFVYKLEGQRLNIQYFEKMRNEILSKWRLHPDLLKFQLDKLKIKLNIFLSKLTGYTTYGDYEGFYSIYISVLMDYLDFNSFLDNIKKSFENIPERKGLVDFLKIKLKDHYIHLEQMIKANANLNEETEYLNLKSASCAKNRIAPRK